MDVSIEDFRQHFALLSDDALLETRREDLVPKAQQCYDEELSRRGLTHASPVEAEASDEAQAAPDDPGGEPVSIATYTVAEEASLARGLLRMASIPCHIANEYTGLGSFELQLMVPAAFVEHALEVLGAEISDEELAAQAEAAGAFEEEPPESESEETQA